MSQAIRQIEKVIYTAKACPYSKAVRGNINVETNVF
jgi:organic hydroperoxide reductase OsmC/OhrA